MSRKITLFLALIIIMGALAGCSSTHKVLHDTDTLRVERDGRSLVVYDLAGDATYTLATKRVLKGQQETRPRNLVDTETITITAQPNVTTILDKTAGTKVTITHRRHL